MSSTIKQDNAIFYLQRILEVLGPYLEKKKNPFLILSFMQW